MTQIYSIVFVVPQNPFYTPLESDAFSETGTTIRYNANKNNIAPTAMKMAVFAVNPRVYIVYIPATIEEMAATILINSGNSKLSFM
jgi:hypothetical protein